MWMALQDESGKDTATKLYDLFERVRESTVQTVTVEVRFFQTSNIHLVLTIFFNFIGYIVHILQAYDVSPEQMGLLCYLLALTLSPTSKTISDIAHLICLLITAPIFHNYPSNRHLIVYELVAY